MTQNTVELSNLSPNVLPLFVRYMNFFFGFYKMVSIQEHRFTKPTYLIIWTMIFKVRNVRISSTSHYYGF